MIICLGATFCLLLRQVTLYQALHSINLEILGYLFGVFVIAEVLELSGELERLAEIIFSHSRNSYHTMAIIMFSSALGSAFLMNDTLAIIGTPVILKLCRHHKALALPLLFSLCFSVTIGSVFSPIGNPQNLLITIDAPIHLPFTTFFKTIALPSFINLFLTWIILSIFFKKTLCNNIKRTKKTLPVNHKLSILGRLSLLLMLCLIAIKIVLAYVKPSYQPDFALIALTSCLPILMMSSKRFVVLKKIDWQTLAFFVGLFILMQAVWVSGFFQQLAVSTKLSINNIPTILGVSTLLSQVLSNVPLVALYLPLLKHAGASMVHYLALAAGSTIAGNLFVLGAASNIIIFQSADKRGEKLSYLAFSKVGVLVTLNNLLVYYLFLQY